MGCTSRWPSAPSGAGRSVCLRNENPSHLEGPPEKGVPVLRHCHSPQRVPVFFQNTGPTLVRSEASTRWMLQQVNTRSSALWKNRGTVSPNLSCSAWVTTLTAGIIWPARYLVDPASSHMLVSKIKPCMSKYKPLYGETADGSLKQSLFT